MNLNNLNFEILIKKLQENYAKINIDGIICYYYIDHNNKVTSRIVAIQPTENTVGVCVNTYDKDITNNEYKSSFVLFNEFNPSFIIFANQDDQEELQQGITVLVDILKITGDMSVISFGNNNLNVAQFNYDSNYKVQGNPMYNKTEKHLNIKAIGDITRHENKSKIRLKKLGLSFINLFEKVFVTGNHEDFKEAVFDNIFNNNTEIAHKKLQKKTK